MRVWAKGSSTGVKSSLVSVWMSTPVHQLLQQSQAQSHWERYHTASFFQLRYMDAQAECAKESVTPVCVSLKVKGTVGRFGLRRKSKRKEKKEGQCVWEDSIVLQRTWDGQKTAKMLYKCVLKEDNKLTINN